MQYLFTITEAMRKDPKAIPTATRFALRACLGLHIQRGDVGKRVYQDGDQVYVEHDEQRAERLSKAYIEPAKSAEVCAQIDTLQDALRKKIALLDELRASVTYRTKAE